MIRMSKLPHVRIATLLAVISALAATPLLAQQWLNAGPNPRTNQSNFRAIEEWPDPNNMRTASGSPGPDYWQQRVDYVIKATLDTVTHTLKGTERITYHNNSPDALP